MIVYGNSLSPYVRKVLVICAEKGIAVENRPAGPGTPPTPEFLEASPFQRVPAIVDGDFLLSDSSAIAHYLEAKHPSPALLPAEPEALGRVVWFDELVDTIVFASGAKMFRNRVVARLLRQPQDLELADTVEREELPAQLDYLERMITADGWLVGDSFTLADVAVGSVFVNLTHAQTKIDAHPKLAAYLARVHARPSFAPIIAQESGFLARALGG